MLPEEVDWRYPTYLQESILARRYQLQNGRIYWGQPGAHLQEYPTQQDDGNSKC